MKRFVVATAVILLALVHLSAQSPRGWKLRIDRSVNATDPDAAGDIKFTTVGSGYQAINPQAAVYWNPANTVTGNYSLKGTFKLLKLSGHTNYYGLVFGGRDLEGDRQNYVYFMVAQDGTWLLKRREGENAPTISGPTPNAVIRKPDARGQSTNALEVRVLGDRIDYAVNGTVVHTTPKTGPTANTNGIYGIRVNHLLEVQVDGLAVTRQ